MFTLFNRDIMTRICYDTFEKLCVVKAIEDLQKDILTISGRKPVVENFILPQFAGKIVVGSLANVRFAELLEKNHIDVSEIKDKWEHYIIRTIGESENTLLIAGSDERGTMWGIYEFSKLFLDVNPLYLWTDYIPQKKEEVVLSKTDICDGPKTYKFRGWFINDEDLLIGFTMAGPPVSGDFHSEYTSTLGIIVETGLRLKQNLLIPSSHVDIEKPEDEAMIKLITDRGMFISMHHGQPVGVEQSIMELYWKERGIEGVNYVQHKEQYEQLWRQYIRKWSKYDNVIWQLGLRGKGDSPVWSEGPGMPVTMQERGRLISDAIQKQLDIIREENPGKEINSSTTLWMEGMPLYNENVLTFPKGTRVVLADFAPEQMWGVGYYTTQREADRAYGVYYHVGFWGCGPHLVQGNRPEKIYYNYRDAVDKGDVDYSILNVANLREHVYNLNCVADITWDIDRVDAEEYRLKWCREQLKALNASKVAEVYKEYYECFHEIDGTLIPGQMLFMDGMARRIAMKLMEIIQGEELVPVAIQNARLYEFASTNEFIAYYKNATAEGLRRFKKLYSKAVEAKDVVGKDRQDFYVSNMIVHIEIIMGLYAWVYNLCLAAEDRRGNADNKAYENYLDEAVYALSKVSMDRTKALSGKWEHWYDGDYLIGIQGDIRLTKSLYLTEDNMAAVTKSPDFRY